MCGDKVLEDCQAFTEVRLDWQFENPSRWCSHQTTHTTELCNLRFVTTRFGVNHEHDGVEAVHRFQQDVRQIILRLRPDLNNTVITLIIGNQTTAVLIRNHIDLGFRFFKNGYLFFRYNNIRYGYSYTRTSGVREAELLDFIQNHRCLGCMVNFKAAGNNQTQILLAYSTCVRQAHDLFADIRAFFIDEVFLWCALQQVCLGCFVNIREAARIDFIEDNLTDSRNEHCVLLGFRKACFTQSLGRNSYASMQACCSTLVSRYGFVHSTQNHTGSLFFLVVHGQIECTKDHILGRGNYRFAILRVQDVA
ncbi:hypothetical protein D3C76_496920 [compost metagenome]